MGGWLVALWRSFCVAGTLCPAISYSQTLFRNVVGSPGSDDKSGRFLSLTSLGYDYDWISKSSRNGLLESRVFGGRAWLEFRRREGRFEMRVGTSNEFLGALLDGESQNGANYRAVRTHVGAKWLGSGVSASAVLEEGSQRIAGSWSEFGKVFDKLVSPSHFEWNNRPLVISGTVQQEFGSHRIGLSFAKNLRQDAPLGISKDPDPLRVSFAFPFVMQTDEVGFILERENRSSIWTVSGATGVTVEKGEISRVSRGVIGRGESETRGWNVAFGHKQRFRSGQEASFWIAGAGYRSKLSGRIRDGGSAGISSADGYRVRYSAGVAATRWDVGLSYSVRAGAEGQLLFCLQMSHLPARFESEVSLSRFLNSVGTRFISEIESLRVFQVGASYTRDIVDGVTLGVAIKQVVPTKAGGSGAGGGVGGSNEGRRAEGGTLISIEVRLGLQ